MNNQTIDMNDPFSSQRRIWSKEGQENHYQLNLTKLIIENFGKRKIYTEDLLINCSKPICIVGNALINDELGNVIDSYATVIRMNNYKITGYEKYVGSKTDLRCVTGWLDVENRNEFIEFSPFTESANESKNIVNYNSKNKNQVITALSDVHKFIHEIQNPSAGFALVQLFNNLGLEIDLFGFDGFKTNHYWEKDVNINTTHSNRELDFIVKRENVIVVDKLFSYKEIYDHCHSKYCENDDNVGLHVIKSLNKLFEGKRILEFGAGNNNLSKYLEELGNDVTAIEVSKNAFEKIQCRNKIIGDVFKLLKNKEQFDYLISIDVLEHLSEIDIKLFLKYISKKSRSCFLTISTRPSGLLGPNGENLNITVKDKDWWFSIISKYYDVKIYEGPYESQFILEGASRFLDEDCLNVESLGKRTYYIKESYVAREIPEYFVDETSIESGINYQPEIYPLAAKLAKLVDAKYIIDIGCGSGEKLVKLYPQFEIIGIDFGPNIEKCKQKYKFGNWIDFDLESALSIPIPHEIAAQSIIINSDVIEHLKNPLLLLEKIKLLLNHAKAAIISTPERELNWGLEHNGPPPNSAHVREWNIHEFTKMLDSQGIKIGCVGTTISNDKENEEKTIISIVVNKKLQDDNPIFDKANHFNIKQSSIYYHMDHMGHFKKYKRMDITPKKYLASNFKFKSSKKLNVVAIISAYNEGDIIYHVIGDLIENGVSVYLLNHNSSDETVSEASRWLGRGLIEIENFPSDSNYPKENNNEYVWKDILKRKEELSFLINADWYIHADADEFRESPWVNMNLLEAITYVDELGYNAIDFNLLQFRPTNNDFMKGDVREYLQYFEEGEDFNAYQIKAWKNLGVPINLPEFGGHEVNFPNRKIFPIPFILRHYPIRNEEHGLRKIFQERIPRFNEKEKSMGWHIQYDSISKDYPKILYKESVLNKYEPAVYKTKLLAAYSQNMLELLSQEKEFNFILIHKYDSAFNEVEGLTKSINNVIAKAKDLPTDNGIDGSPNLQSNVNVVLRQEQEVDQKARTETESIIKHNLKAVIELSEIQLRKGNIFDAYLTLQKILKDDSNYEDAKIGMVKLNDQIKKKKAEKKWNSKKSVDCLLKAERAIEKQKLDEAQKKLLEILNLEPDHLEALNNLSVVAILENKMEYASDILKIVLMNDPMNEIAIGNMNYLQEQIQLAKKDEKGLNLSSINSDKNESIKASATMESPAKENVILSPGTNSGKPKGLICLNPFYEFEIDITGKVVVCCTAWLKHSLGNMKKFNIAEIWNSQAARYIRRKMYKGEWEDICNASCPTIVQHNKFGKVYKYEELHKNPHLTPKHVEEILAGKDKLESTPTVFKLSDSKVCNLKCKMCSVIHTDDLIDDAEMIERRSEDIKQYLDKAKTILVSGNGDPFARKDTRELMMNYDSSKSDVQFSVVTNGLLLPRYWDKVKHQRFESIDISIDSPVKEVYEKIRYPGKWEDILKTLDLVKENKSKFKHVLISMVVMRSNYKLIPAFNDMAESYGFLPLYSRIHGMFEDENIFEMNDKAAIDELRSIVSSEKKKKRSVNVIWQDLEEFAN